MIENVVFSNWVGELTSTVGDGPISLGGAINGFSSFSQFPDGSKVVYTIQDGFDKETGVGTLNGRALERTTIGATLVDGVYTISSSPLNLSGNSQVYATMNAELMKELKDAHGDISDIMQRTINGHTLTTDVLLSASDVGAQAESPVLDKIVSGATATTTEAGVVNLATTSEAVVGTDNSKALTPNAGVALAAYQIIAEHYRKQGMVTAGTFEDGAHVIDANQVVISRANGVGYTYLGTIATGGFGVVPGSTPDANWKAVVTDTTSAEISIGDAPPANAKATSLWYNTLDGRMYIRYQDADSLQWVEASPQSSIADIPEDVSNKIREALRRSYAEAGYTLVTGSFEAGGTLTSATDVLLQEKTGKVYSWTGAYPSGGYIVVAGTDPASVAGFASMQEAKIKDLLYVQSISSLLDLKPYDGMRVDVVSFYAGKGKGGGVFVYNQTIPRSSHNGITIVSHTAVFDGTQANAHSFLTQTGFSDNGCWVRLLDEPVINVFMGGAIADNATDDYPCCQAVHDIGLHVKYGAGNYLFNTAVELVAGCNVTAEKASYPSKDAKKHTSIRNPNVDGGIFHYVKDKSVGQLVSPSISGFDLTADYPIMLNNYNDKIGDGAQGVNPYLMRGKISDNFIHARTKGVGVGIAVSKFFDGIIENNETYSHQIGILLLGSDINDVRRNRVVDFTLYGICDRSSGTFGSQNEIALNDILAAGSTTATYIKSTSRHHRIYNNYCEIADHNIKGFIDLTRDGIPQWNVANVDSNSYSIIVKDNRLDGFHFCTSFVYQIDGDQPAMMTVIDDSKTVGEVATVPVLKMLSSTGANLTKIVYSNTSSLLPEFYFRGGFDRFCGFGYKFGSDECLTITAENVAKIVAGNLYANGLDAYLRTDGESICIMPGFTSVGWFVPVSVDGVNNVFLANGVSYKCEIVMRASTPLGDTVSFARIVDGGGDSLNAFTLTDQFKKFSFNMSGAVKTSAVGIYFARGTQNGIVMIKSIKFIPV